MFKRKIVKNRQFFFLLILYTISHICFYANDYYVYLFKPMFWFIFLIGFYYQDLQLPKKKEIHITLIISMIFFLLYFVSGFIVGFHKSPSNDSLMPILINIWKDILPICGMEIIRYKLLKSNKNNFVFNAFITTMIIFSEMNFKDFFLSNNIVFFHYLTSTMIPIIAQNILYTYLSLNAHYGITIIIKIFRELPKIILPIIPYSNWFMKGSFAIIKVFIIYYLFKYFIFSKVTKNHSTNLGVVLYPFTIIISILLVVFMLGLFPYQPIAILSNSMNPTFQRGDVVIYKKTENIEPNDIIVFEYQNQMIVHRVISINPYYVTKGDANKNVDYIKVQKEDIKGVYQFSLKYLGYPSIWLNELLSKED